MGGCLLEVGQPLVDAVSVLADARKAFLERAVQRGDFVVTFFSKYPPHGVFQTGADIKIFPTASGALSGPFSGWSGMVPGRSQDIPRTVLGLSGTIREHFIVDKVIPRHSQLGLSGTMVGTSREYAGTIWE